MEKFTLVQFSYANESVMNVSSCYIHQGRHQGKSLGGRRNLGGQGGSAPGRGPGGRAPWWWSGGKAPWSWSLFSAKIVIEALQSTYFLAKGDIKANFNNFDAWKYPIFFHFPFFEICRGAFAPLAPPPPMAPPLTYTGMTSSIHSI